jgi:ABC-type cobalamin/Fe3+-siderophores transport system ATPase subunit
MGFVRPSTARFSNGPAPWRMSPMRSPSRIPVSASTSSLVLLRKTQAITSSGRPSTARDCVKKARSCKRPRRSDGRTAPEAEWGPAPTSRIARALYTRHKLLVLDDATCSLDVETERDITCTIQGLEESATTSIIAHRLSTVRHVDQVL